MFPAPTLQVVEHTPSRVVVSVPPLYVLGVAVLIVGLLIPVLLGTLRSAGESSNTRMRLFPLLVSLPLLIAGVYMLGSSGELTLSRETNEVRSDRRFFGYLRSSSTTPLNNVHDARAQRYQGSQRLVLVLQSGTVIDVSGASLPGGTYAAANVINDFLYGSRR